MKKLFRKFILLLIAEEFYAIPLVKDGKFVDYKQISILPVPQSSKKIIGLTYLEGKIVTVLNTAKILNLSGGRNNLIFLFEFDHSIYGLAIQGSGEIIKTNKILINKKREEFKKYIKVKNKKIYILDLEDIFNKISNG